MLALEVLIEVGVGVVEGTVHACSVVEELHGGSQVVAYIGGTANCDGFHYNIVFFECGGLHDYFHTIAEGEFDSIPLGQFLLLDNLAGCGQLRNEGFGLGVVGECLDFFGVNLGGDFGELLFGRIYISFAFGHHNHEYAVVFRHELGQKLLVDYSQRYHLRELLINLVVGFDAGYGVAVEEVVNIFLYVRSGVGVFPFVVELFDARHKFSLGAVELVLGETAADSAQYFAVDGFVSAGDVRTLGHTLYREGVFGLRQEELAV